MEETTREDQIKNAESSKIDNIRTALDNIKNKTNRFLFFVTSTNNPAASIYEIYNHATILKKMGYKVTMLTDTADYEKPTWIESELIDHPHEALTGVKLTVGPADVLIIPEIFSNVMEQTKHLPCIRIALLQSIDYMLNALIPATEWSTFGINKVITTSNKLKSLFEEFYGKGIYDVKTYAPNIPDYFYENGEMKRPVLSIVGRNPNEISKIVKLFYAKYPQYTWIGFDSMVTNSKPPVPLDRKSYAERLKTNFASVWVDRISSFGTFPLEAMKAGSIPIGIIPDIIPEYLIDNEEGEDVTGAFKLAKNSGVWTNELYRLPVLIGEVLTKFLDDSIEEEVYEGMKKIASKYNPERTENELKEYYQEVLDERILLFETAIADFDNENKEKEPATKAE